MPVFRTHHTQTIHTLLSESTDLDTKDNLSLYRLQYACFHQVVLGDTERVWTTLHDPTYNNLQISHTKDYEWTKSSLHHGLALFVSQQGVTVADDARLSWLMLRAGEIAQEAIESVHIAFEWFREDASLLDAALMRVSVLNEENYFKACLKLLMIEAWRQQEWEPTRRDVSVPQKILEALDERVPDGIGTVNWADFLSEEWIAWWIALMWETWDDLDLNVIKNRSKVVTVLIDAVRLICERMSQSKIQSLLHTVSSDTTLITSALDYGNELAKILTKQGYLQKALSIADKINYDKLKTYAEIAKILAEQGNIEQALIVADKVTSGFDKIKAYVEIAKILTKQGHIQKANEILNLTILLTEKVSDSIPTYSYSWAYFQVTLLVIRQKNIEQALSLNEKITSDFEKSKIYIEIAKILTEQGNTQKANKILELPFLLAKKTLKEDDKSRLYVAIAHAFTEQGHIQKALFIADTILHNVWTEQVYFFVAKALASQGNVELALSLTERITESVFPLRQSNTYNFIAKTLASQGNVEHALTIADKIDCTYDSIKYDTYVDIAQILTEQGHTQKALLLAKNIPDLWKTKVYTFVAKYFSEQSDIKISNSIFEQSFIITKQVNLYWWTPNLSQPLSRILAEQGHIQKSLIVADKIGSGFDQLETYVEIARILTEQGHIQKANEILNLTILLTEKITDNFDKNRLYELLAIYFTMQKDFAQATSFAQKITFDLWKIRMCETISEIADEEDRFEQTEESFKNNTQNIGDENSYASFIKQHDVQEALSKASQMKDHAEKSVAYLNIAKTLAANNLIVKSNQILTKAIETADHITNEFKPLIYIKITEALTEQEQTYLLYIHLTQHSYSNKFYTQFLPNYQELLTNTHLLRQSYLFAFFIPSLARSSVLNTINHHLRKGNDLTVNAIIRQCPQLKLDFLLPENSDQ